jgi:anti-anti-sigma factor
LFSGKDETAPQSIAGIEDYPSIRIVRLRGKIDQQTVAELARFRKWVGKHKGFQHKHVLIDFKDVSHVDTAAVAEIIQEVSELKTEHLRLGAVHLNNVVRAMFQVLKVEKLISIYENESAALEDMTRNHPSQ